MSTPDIKPKNGKSATEDRELKAFVNAIDTASKKHNLQLVAELVATPQGIFPRLAVAPLKEKN